MASIIEDYLREVEASLRVEPERKSLILNELRSHLREKVADLEREDPARPRESIERQVLAEMGSPRDLAVGYDAGGAQVVRTGAGETILRLTEAAGRGLGKMLKWTAIGLACLLVLALIVGTFAFFQLKPVIAGAIHEHETIYSLDQTCAGTPCYGALPSDVFHVENNTTSIRFVLSLTHAHNPDSGERVGNGSILVVVRDPAGATRLNRTFSMDNGSELDTENTWAATPGDWTVSLEFHGFLGEIDANVYPRETSVTSMGSG